MSGMLLEVTACRYCFERIYKLDPARDRSWRHGDLSDACDPAKKCIDPSICDCTFAEPSLAYEHERLSNA